jgi:LL-diaminopimelate aminotransferase
MVLPALGAKEAIFNANLAFLDPGDVALAPDPGYQIYVAGPLLVGAQPHLLPLRADRGYVPDLTDVPADVLGKAKLLYLNYPNTPTGALAPAGFFEDVVAFAAAHDILVVHDNVYSDITFDGVVAPSFLATPGALDVAIEITSMSKTYNMTGWRCAAVAGNRDAIEAYRSIKTFIDSGMFKAVQAAAVAALDPSMDRVVAESIEIYQRRRGLRVGESARRVRVVIRVLRPRPRHGGGGRVPGVRVRPAWRRIPSSEPHRRG